MTLTIVDEPRLVTGGVDTHADAHVAAALDRIGGLLGVQEFPATPAGYARRGANNRSVIVPPWWHGAALNVMRKPAVVPAAASFWSAH